jgi:hypothetical protein
MNEYIVGTLARITFTITTSAGAPVDSSELTLQIKTPDKVVTDISSSIVHDSAGNYHADFITSQIGPHTYEVSSSGSVQISGLGKFLVTQGIGS